MIQATSPTDVFVARQPIFDRRHDLAAYELLYRATARATTAGNHDQATMTGATLLNSLLGIGLDTLIGGAHAFVNFSRSQLVGRHFEMLPPDRCTIELLETIACDDETVAACSDARDAGFRIALDDFAGGEEYRPLLEMAHIIKIDVLGRTEGDLAATVDRLAPYGTELLAEKIEDARVCALCRKLGFTLFQGFYFSRPETVVRRDLPARVSTVAKLMNLVADNDVSDREIEAAFRPDPGLSFKLLRIANSSAFGMPGVSTIGQAIRMVGRGPLHRWLALLFANLAPNDTGVNAELILTALERGRLCEIMAERGERPRQAQALFLAGLLSNFDVILGVSMPELVRKVHVSPEVEAALLGDDGPFTPYLAIAAACVQGDLDRAAELGEVMGVGAQLPAWYMEASAWARGLVLAA
jgi:EAL and modified HD-GYP domain-containing signal transduction protein